MEQVTNILYKRLKLLNLDFFSKLRIYLNHDYYLQP